MATTKSLAIVTGTGFRPAWNDSDGVPLALETFPRLPGMFSCSCIDCDFAFINRSSAPTTMLTGIINSPYLDCVSMALGIFKVDSPALE